MRTYILSDNISMSLVNSNRRNLTIILYKNTFLIFLNILLTAQR